MDAFSAEHLAVLAGTAVACVAIGAGARRAPADARWPRLAGWALAALLLANEVVFTVVHHLDVGLSARDDLPVHLTDVATLVAIAALWRPSPLAFELTYFWAFTATLQALITPDLGRSFPDYRWWWFVVAHSGVLAAATLLAWGLRRTPRPGAPLRVVAWTVPVAVAAGLASWAFDGNYMFLREPPGRGSLLDLMGPWPWYVASAAALALALFWLLDRPFGRRRAAARLVRVDRDGRM
ncbi:TIGR02206 family membrane protein [Miltoncostaea marina]|uniref:YwaF family protein n=1 Tax=Miltoncostaea marina TaxID=2843215 RepID=UPI001C3C56BB|nr:TIGR02206 family membrane protein [Miltoncostaea marina]